MPKQEDTTTNINAPGSQQINIKSMRGDIHGPVTSSADWNGAETVLQMFGSREDINALHAMRKRAAEGDVRGASQIWSRLSPILDKALERGANIAQIISTFWSFTGGK